MSADIPSSQPGASLTRFRDGSAWETVAGYSRSARSGNVVAVSGTTAPDGARLFPGDTYGQTASCLRQVVAAVEALGGRDIDIIRTRIMLVPGADVEGASRAHLEVLGHVAPANSLYFVAGLVGEGLLVEVEGDAVVGGTP
ncbi:enamine deaminase RidA (YjgF/YER057c/UK114 family) [Nakamurella sp. UYEF19]|uniref:Rid family hydrolase n=1 Tax=Nakamurella sp. UYEF19 TaxID=1756392 RepID=UPI003391063B